MPNDTANRRGFALAELLAVVVILAIVAAYVIPRTSGQVDRARRNACHAQRGEIELQSQLWRRSHGSYPGASLGDIAADTDYFPQGLPTCPVDGTPYTIDTTTGTVTGHEH